MAIALVVAVLAAAGYLSTQKASYETVATVQLAVPSQGQQQQSTPTINTDSQLVTGPEVRSGALAALKLTGAAELPATVTATYDAVRSVMSIKSSASTAAAAQSVANAITNAYVAVQKKTQDDAFSLVRKNRDSLQAQLAALQKQVTANPKDQLSQAQLTAIIASYTTVAQQVATQSLVGPPATLVQSAGPGVEKSTQRGKVLGLAAVVGLLIGTGLALLRDPFDTSVRDVERAEQISHAAVLSELPNVRGFRRDRKPLPVLDKPRSPFAAGIRELRTSAQVLLADVDCPIVVVTSPSPVDGKTVVAANLAASFALSGKRTVLISADMRRPRVDSYFSTKTVSELPGLANLLDQDALQWQADGAGTDLPSLGGEANIAAGDVSESVSRTLIRTQIPRLWMLPAGAVRRDPADLLAGPVTTAALAYLRSVADVIVIDTPPVLAAADTAIMASVADGVLLVARVAKTDSAHLSDSVRRLEASRAPLLGLVLNRSKTQAAIRYRDYYVDTPVALAAGPGSGAGTLPDVSSDPRGIDIASPDRGRDADGPTAPATQAKTDDHAERETPGSGPSNASNGDAAGKLNGAVTLHKPAKAQAGASADAAKPTGNGTVAPASVPAAAAQTAPVAPADKPDQPREATTVSPGQADQGGKAVEPTSVTERSGRENPARLRIISAVKVAGAVKIAGARSSVQSVPSTKPHSQSESNATDAERQEQPDDPAERAN